MGGGKLRSLYGNSKESVVKVDKEIAVYNGEGKKVAIMSIPRTKEEIEEARFTGTGINLDVTIQ